MPFTAIQLASGADYALDAYQKKEPIDQINFQHVTLDWFMRNKEASSFTGGSFKEPIYVTNNSNYQRYFGADQVTFNERDPVDWTDFPWYNVHDGFWFDEDTLLAAGITITDDTNAIPTANEKEVLVDRLKISYRTLKDSLQEGLAYDILRDGSQSTKAVPGLASIVDPTPATGVVGGIDAATATYWRNNANLGFAAADIVAEMEETWAASIRYGGMKPNFIVAGRAFYDAYVANTITAVQRHQAVQGSGAVIMDPSVEAVNFRGVPVVWDPTFEALDALLSTTTQTKTAYMLNSKAITLRPVKNNWMVDRRPERLPDRYVHYFAKTAKFGLTVNKRNALAVLSIA